MFPFGLEMPHLQPKGTSRSQEAAALKCQSTCFTVEERGGEASRRRAYRTVATPARARAWPLPEALPQMGRACIYAQQKHQDKYVLTAVSD